MAKRALITNKRHDYTPRYDSQNSICDVCGLARVYCKQTFAPRESLWKRFKVKLFGGEGTVRDLFR